MLKEGKAAMAHKVARESHTSTIGVLLLATCFTLGGTIGCSSSGGETTPTGSGGAKATGGAAGTGGAVGTGGASSAGGAPGTGGSATTGGSASSGGSATTGGATNSGGTTKAGTGGSAGSAAGGSAGGAPGAGGAGTGGVSGTGGSGTGAGGAQGTGGLTTKTGGTTGAGGGAGGATGGGGGSGAGGGSSAGLPAAADILAILKKVIPYEIQLGPEDPSWVNKWTEATFYIGVMEAYSATGDATYLTDATNWGTKNKWTLLGSPTRSADNQCAGQVYEDTYLANPVASNANMYANLKTNIDAMKANPSPGISKSNDWWWCDALFMAPGGVSRMGKITGDATYYSFLDTMWAATQKGLFDSKTGLFWRDSTFVNGTTYWSRGNGWVMGGLARVLEYLPATDASYNSYVTLLKTMAAAVQPYQQADGTWHSDLTHPTTYNNPEVSGTGLMTYAIAYGINQGLLDKATYQPVVAAAWKGLANCVDTQGRVGYIQATGSAPAAAAATETHDYGVGAFVLAASQIYLMVK